MHASLSELLENLENGLLWVGQDGQVRHVNTHGGQRSGLGVGRKLFDPELKKAVVEAIETRTPRMCKAIGAAPRPGAAPTELSCRVLPGLSKDDAFVLIQNGGSNPDDIGFDNLMQVIRADLRDPLVAAQGQLQQALKTGVVSEMSLAAERTTELLKVVDRLVDLADVWRSEALMASDRIEIWPLLQQAWSEVEPLAKQRSVTARLIAEGALDNMAVLYGSLQWLERVFKECLEMAVRGVVSGGALEIEHRQMGGRAIIILRDLSVFANEDQDKGVELKAVPAAKPAAGAVEPKKRSANEAIGLHLAQHIVSLHGGQLREEHEGGVHTFVIDLPTGAPHHFDSSQLDIAQAQQYARDLAALMARARKRQTPTAPSST